MAIESFPLGELVFINQVGIGAGGGVGKNIPSSHSSQSIPSIVNHSSQSIPSIVNHSSQSMPSIRVKFSSATIAGLKLVDVFAFTMEKLAETMVRATMLRTTSRNLIKHLNPTISLARGFHPDEVMAGIRLFDLTQSAGFVPDT